MALILAIVGLLAVFEQARQNTDYSSDIARGVGAWSVPLLPAVVSVVLAATSLSAARRDGRKGTGPAVTAIVLGGLATLFSLLHIVGMILVSG